MSRLDSKTIVITGGNSGIGLAAARALRAEGARVVLFGRDEETVAAAAEELGEDALGVVGDVTRPGDLRRLFDEAAARFGGVDGLFVNAGIAHPMPFEQADGSFFDQLFDVNVKGAYFTVQAALPHLRPGASVVLTTSALNVKGMPGMSIYSATKAALRSMTRSLAAELAPRGVRVNSIAPGAVETPIYARMGLPEAQLQQMSAGILGSVALGRFGKADEIGRAVAFLLSDDSSYMLGSELYVDGGFAQL